MIEFEIKIKNKIDPIRQKLEDLGAELLKKDYNNDTYYNHPNKNFKHTDEALRIRETSEGRSITYKGPKFNDQSKSRKEIDVHIGEGMDEILLELGFIESGIVKKERETWELNDIQVTLDIVEGLGEFVELEIQGNQEDDLEDVVKSLKQVAIRLDLSPSEQITKSYLELLESR